MLRTVLMFAALVWWIGGAARAQPEPDHPAAAPAPPAPEAQAAPDLAKEKLCLSCHRVDTKLVGPAYRDVAAKYRGQADAEAMLIAKVRAGGKGVWGKVAMPPHTLTDAEAETLIQWVLSQ